MKKSFNQIVEDIGKDTLSRLVSKVPDWSIKGLEIPSRLNMEQCSSSLTAAIKASKAASAIPGATRIADLTGGLGVDTWAFARRFEEVFYNDMNPVLVQAVRHNFELLGVKNVQFSCASLEPGKLRDVLGSFHPDILFLDPARRSDQGGKLFFLEDCSPDLIALKDELLGIAPKLMVKISPMADISLLRRQLSDCLEEICIVGAEGECKELLLLLKSGADAAAAPLRVLENGAELSFSASELSLRAVPKLLCDLSSLKSGAVLFIPSASLMKSGTFAALSRRFGLEALGASTHLFRVCGDVGQCSQELSSFGKFSLVSDVLPFGKETFKLIRQKYPRADVTARNLPLNSEALRLKLGLKGGGPEHIYGVSVDCPAPVKCLLITQPFPEASYDGVNIRDTSI